MWFCHTIRSNLFGFIRVVVTHFWVLTQKVRKYKKKIFRRNQKITEARKGCWNVE
jgi:hypothetical protein